MLSGVLVLLGLEAGTDGLNVAWEVVAAVSAGPKGC